ncbi:hypothetical protein RDWZM_008599 [Blomia tropicalis]|uniref:Uncharacterized protein n=1 Tax=Blomia tropicalis TaxID=40697 RepID=A0A9Q0M4J6_BLOTA|nr:hypothetical protein BLOT_004275 [Blomia tropicalis]KAJ6217442.1 hypothetical protein RDWZM_008599 [Blomia tropicalis]
MEPKRKNNGSGSVSTNYRGKNRGKSILQNMPQVQGYKFISRDMYNKERSFKHLSEQNSNKFNWNVKNSTKRNGKFQPNLKNWSGYNRRQMEREMKKAICQIRSISTGSEISNDEMEHLNMEVRTTTNNNMKPYNDQGYKTVKTIEVEYIPHHNQSLLYGGKFKLEMLEGLPKNLKTSNVPEIFHESGHMGGSGGYDHNTNQNLQSSLSINIKSGSDRSMNETYAKEEKHQWIKRGRTNNGLIVEHIHETVMTTKTAVTRDVFKYMVKGPQEKSLISIKHETPLINDLLDESKISDGSQRQPSLVPHPASTVTIKSIAIPTKLVKVEALGKKPLIGSGAIIINPIEKNKIIMPSIRDDETNGPQRTLITRPNEYGDKDERDQLKDSDTIAALRSENPNLPSQKMMAREPIKDKLDNEQGECIMLIKMKQSN